MLKRLQAYLIRALRWSEQYTGTDMVYLAHGSFWLSGSSVITGAVSFSLALAFANLFTKDAYGTYKYVLTLFGIFSVACLRPMDDVIKQGAARNNDGTVILGLHTKMRWALLGSLAAILAAAYYFYSGNTVVAAALLFAAIFIPLMEPFGVFNAVLVGKLDFKLSSLLGIAGQVAAAAALTIALLVTNNPVIIFVVYCSAWTVTRYMSLQLTLKKFPPNQKQEPHALSYAFHSSVINVAGTLISSLDAILVYHYLGAAQLAVYSFAMAPVVHARAILDTPSVLAIPKLAGQSASNIKKMLAKRTGILFLLGIVITMGYCVLAVPFFHIFFPKYIDAIPYSLVFSVTILLQVGGAFVASAVNSRVTLIPKHLLYLSNIPGVVLAASALLLIQRFGLWGAISGQLLSFASGAVPTWIMWYAIRDKEH